MCIWPWIPHNLLVEPRAPKVFNPSKSRWMICIYPKIMGSIDLIHETRHPCRRLECRDWWDKCNVTWYLKGQEKLVETRTLNVVHRDTDLPTSWVLFFFFSWALSISGRFLTFSAIKASERAGVLWPTTRTKTSRKSNRENKQTPLHAITPTAKFYNLFAPGKIQWHCIYPINPKGHAKMAG